MFAEMNKFWKFLYFFPVLPVYFIILTVIYTFTNYYLLDGSEMTFWKSLISFLFYVFATMTIFCHTFSMIINPGYVEQEKMVNYKIEEIDEKGDNDKNKTEAKNPLFCKKCNKSRPHRSHHCSTCKKCVLKMDHHCPWIFNCVGYWNQKAFYLFLFYASFGDLIACVCLVMKIIDPNFFQMIIRPKRRINPMADWIILEIFKSMKDPLLIILGACLSFTMTLAIGILFIYQTYLIFNNLTSIESSHYKNNKDSPFHSKNKFLMFKSVIGLKFDIFWFLPMFRPNQFNNGYTFMIPDKSETTIIPDEKKTA